MKSFALPNLGEGLTEAEIVSWHVSEGDHVVADQPLVAVETEKAVVEVPSPQSGRIHRLFGKTGGRIRVGTTLVEFAETEGAASGTVVGELRPAPPVTPLPSPRRAAPSPAVKAAPAVRELARSRGLDLADIMPTGPGGSVTRADVLATAESAMAAGGGEELGGVRRSMAINMARAHASVVPATVFDEVDIEGWWAPAAEVTLRLIRAIAAGVAAAPALNAWFDGATLRRRLHRAIDPGIAVDTADGLLVPVLRNISAAEPGELRRRLDALKAAARSRTLRIDDLRGATLTLSNFGMLAGRHAVLVVVPPQVAIIGAGRIGPRPVAEGGGAGAHHILPLSLTFDHRAVAGAEAARLLAAMIEDLERPA
jgi:pyruvate dehydrogenase E2 component (dihydrolipoamide acetyltransferase)